MATFVTVATSSPPIGPVVFGQTPRTVRDRIYTEDQAAQGKAIYDAKCSACHDGTGLGPELKDPAYLNGWENKNVRAFYSRVLTTMPENEPGSLSETEVLDILAFLLQTNGFPAGETPLKSATDLDGVTFVRAK
jgi:mono/diheme cytochrome c family protein